MARWRMDDPGSQGDIAFAGVGASDNWSGGERSWDPWGRGPWGRGPWGGGPGGGWGHGRGPGGWGYGEWGHGFKKAMRRHMFRHMMRHFGPCFFAGAFGGFGPGRFGRGFGPGGFGPGGFGPGGFGHGGFGPGGRMFGRGDLKYALLGLLQEGPKHGYEMIKELESRAGGFYTPSAGAVYPTLQLMEDRGWVRSETQEGKKVYTITDAGRQELAEHQARQQERAERHGHGHGPGGWGGWGGWGEHGRGRGRFAPSPEARQEMRSMALEGREVARLMRAAVLASAGNPERLAQLHGIVARARSDLQAFLGQQPSGESGSQQRGQGQQTSGPTGPVEQV